MKKNKRLILFISVSVIIVLFIISIFIFLATSTKKEIEIDSLKNELLNNFSSSDLREMDQVEVSDLFGFSKTDVEDGIFLTLNDSASDEDESEIEDETESGEITANPEEMFVFIENTNMDEEDFEDYYILIKGYIESVSTNEEDEKIKTLYEDVVSEKKDNYFYFIIGKHSNDILKVVKDYV